MHGGIAEVVLVFVAVADLWIAFRYATHQQVQCDECVESIRTEKKKWPTT
jgi:hypothetical protein